jgi:hypothetical protein
MEPRNPIFGKNRISQWVGEIPVPPRNPIFGKNRISQIFRLKNRAKKSDFWEKSFGYFCYPALVQDCGNFRITQKSYFWEKSDF